MSAGGREPFGPASATADAHRRRIDAFDAEEFGRANPIRVCKSEEAPDRGERLSVLRELYSAHGQAESLQIDEAKSSTAPKDPELGRKSRPEVLRVDHPPECGGFSSHL